MKTLKYTLVKTEKQYNLYCSNLENLLIKEEVGLVDEIELLTLLIEKWDQDHSTLNDLDPVQLLKALMVENDLRASHLTNILELSKGTVSKILNYHKGLSKNSIRKLSAYFKVSQEVFNRAYTLINTEPQMHNIETRAENRLTSPNSAARRLTV